MARPRQYCSSASPSFIATVRTNTCIHHSYCAWLVPVTSTRYSASLALNPTTMLACHGKAVGAARRPSEASRPAPLTSPSAPSITGCIPLQAQPCAGPSPACVSALRSARHRQPGMPVCLASSQQGELWTPAGTGGDVYQQGAQRLQAFMEAFPELSEEALAGLLSVNPAMVAQDPGQIRSSIEALASGLGVPLAKVARLAAKVAATLERPTEEVVAKVQATAAELGVSVEAQVDLYVSQPAMWHVNQPSIIKGRLDVLGTKLGVPTRIVAEMVGRQSMLLAINPPTILNTVKQVSERLGLTSFDDAVSLVVRMPVVLALDPGLMRLSVEGVSAATGVPVDALLGLLTRALGLISVPTEVLIATLERMAADLDVAPEDVVGLMAKQPTLLCTQALSVLVSQPAMLYDFTIDTVSSRLEALAATFNLPLDRMRAAAAQQPAVLVVSPTTIRSATSLLGSRMGSSLQSCLELLLSDPGEYVLVSYQDSMLQAWSERLGVDPDLVVRLLAEQPALLEMTPNTVKARLESLVALFQVPLDIAAQLALKHPALVAIPPNATITRAKNISMGLKMSMQTASGLIAKEPALLAVLANNAADVRQFIDNVIEVGASYEYYTMEWVQRQIKELQPARRTSFASMH